MQHPARRIVSRKIRNNYYKMHCNETCPHTTISTTIVYMKRLFACIILSSFLFLQSIPTYVIAASPSASAKLIKTKNVVRAYFGNLKGVKSVSYTLYYQGNGIGQGVEGGFKPGKKTSWSKDLFLGTCSSKVCIRHKNIKNIQLEVITRLTNGKSSTKVLKIKV